MVSAKRAHRIRSRETPSKRSLALAFRSFEQIAGSLERSYGRLQAEVLRLRFELERTNRDLAASLEENARMRRYLGSIVEKLPCGILVVDRGGKLRVVNPEARRLLASNSNAPSAAPNAPQMPENLRQTLEAMLASPRRRESELVIETDRGPRLVGLACALLAEEPGQGSASESVFVLRDTTEEKRQAAERELMRRKESIAEMAALLAHEIRNPLGSLELFAGLLADAAAGKPDLLRWTDHIQAGLRLLSATVNNVLQFHNHPGPQLTSIDLGRLLRESLEFLRPLARQGGLRVDLQNPLGDLGVLGDAHRLQQVFFNLALNAFRAMSLGGCLTVRVRGNNDAKSAGVRVEFIDTGRGIPASDLPRLFEPGFTTTAGSPGLGLAVCRAVIDQHHGKIEVASEMGKGTTFAVVLPWAKEAGASA